MKKNSVERELLFMYVVDYCGFHNAEFNFDLCQRYQIDYRVENEKEIRQLKKGFDGLSDSLWNNVRFFGDNISAVTMLIGENGSGKTTFMRLLISWLSLLSVGEEPKEQGLLLFRERINGEDSLFYICFGGLSVKTKLVQEKESSIADVKTYLQKVSLVYYTDTMTDCGTGQIGNKEAYKYLKDWSLLQRLSKRSSWYMPRGYISGTSNKDWIRRIDFQPQIDLYLSLDEKQRLDFPLHVLKFQYRRINTSGYSDSSGLESIPERIWTVEENTPRNKKGNMIPVLLVWDIVYGYISYIFVMKETYGQNWDTIKVILDGGTQELKRTVYSMDSLNRRSVDSLVSTAEGIIMNVFQLIKRVCPHRRQELEDLRDKAIPALSAVKDATNLSFFEQCFVSENQLSSAESIWIIDVSTIPAIELKQAHMNAIRRLFRECDQASLLMQACWFEWQYPSSGGNHFVNLQTVIQSEKLNAVDDTGQQNEESIWFLFDEPDNTFHPRWKRKVVLSILDMCISDDIYCQLWISTHSPILLSDVPKQAAIFLEREGISKRIHDSTYSPFAQQIYRMFQDSFFMEDGAIGSFAEHRIDEALEKGNNELSRIIGIIDEPMLKGYLKMVPKVRGGDQK